MPARLKHALVLMGLLVLLTGGTAWGWSALTKPFPKSTKAPAAAGPCLDTQVAAGALVRPAQVLVNVLNASDRSGLAGTTLDALTKQGFGKGSEGNADSGTDVPAVEVWTGQPDSAAAALVATHLKGATIVNHPDLKTQITVVVGHDFKGVKRGKRAMRAADDLQLCSPPQDQAS